MWESPYTHLHLPCSFCPWPEYGPECAVFPNRSELDLRVNEENNLWSEGSYYSVCN
jgi:hypothetical protein